MHTVSDLCVETLVVLLMQTIHCIKKNAAVTSYIQSRYNVQEVRR